MNTPISNSGKTIKMINHNSDVFRKEISQHKIKRSSDKKQLIKYNNKISEKYLCRSSNLRTIVVYEPY